MCALRLKRRRVDVQFDTDRVELKYDAVTDESLREFVSKHSLPLVMEFTQESAEKIFSGNRKLHLLLFLNKTKPDAESLVSTLQSAAPKYQGKVGTYCLCNNNNNNAQISIPP